MSLDERHLEELTVFANFEGWYQYRLTLDMVKLGSVHNFVMKVRSAGLIKISFLRGNYCPYLAVESEGHIELEVRAILNGIDGTFVEPIIIGNWDPEKVSPFDLTRSRK